MYAVAFDITASCSCGATYVIRGDDDTSHAQDWADNHEHEDDYEEQE